jgi:hypothetical protein
VSLAKPLTTKDTKKHQGKEDTKMIPTQGCSRAAKNANDNR